MRRTVLLFSVALASIAAATVAALLRPPRNVPPSPQAFLPRSSATGPLRMTAQMDRRFLPEQGGGESFLQIDLVAAGQAAVRPRVPVNAVLVLDRSGSMQGEKIERARQAARELITALGEGDRLSIVEFSSSARVLLPSGAVTAATRAAALEAVDALFAAGGTNMSAAFDLASTQLGQGRGAGRVDKVFLASDGQANEGVSDRPGLLGLAARDFGSATLSTFGLGEDYDEEFMNALAAAGGGRARYIASPGELPAAVRGELSRATASVARNVRLRVEGLGGARVERVLGYEGADQVRLPDFAAGEERRVLIKLGLPAGRGAMDLAVAELSFDDEQGQPRKAEVRAGATLTADASRLAEPAGPAAVEGARAELAELATQAARLREQGRQVEARAQFVSMHKVANIAAAAAPGTSILQDEESYERDVAAVDRAGGAASKKLKERAFDAVRAPVKGW
jgi:Ca-activated chloride channel family protein